jgi:hypothetical protein
MTEPHPCHSKWMKFKATFVKKTFTDIWQESLKDFSNSTFQSQANFVPFCLIRKQKLSLCTNITVA